MTLTPEQKAKELVDKYYNSICSMLTYEMCQKCALIAVDEILAANKEVMKLVDGFYMKEYRIHIKYWESVKQAIDNLK